MTSLEDLEAERMRRWRQTPAGQVETPVKAVDFVNEVGIATLYAASTEFPSLYQAYMGDPNPPISAKWDSPSGHVYTWRWEIGRPHSAFYGVVVAKKPTWVSFDNLPVVLGALMDRRTPEEAYGAGELSSNGLAVAQAFEGTEGILSTGELRARAGFEKGKESRAAYLKAVEELDSRLWVAKRFSLEGNGDEMLHALVRSQYADAFALGMKMSPDEALAQLLGRHLQHSVYLDPKVLGRHLRVAGPLFSAAQDRLVESGGGRLETLEGRRFIVSDFENS